jgi:hypothetical protein
MSKAVKRKLYYWNSKFAISKRRDKNTTNHYEIITLLTGEVLPSGHRTDMLQLKKFCEKQLFSMKYDEDLLIKQGKPRSARREKLKNSLLEEAYEWVTSI